MRYVTPKVGAYGGEGTGPGRKTGHTFSCSGVATIAMTG
jgi:hypothetical protein